MIQLFCCPCIKSFHLVVLVIVSPEHSCDDHPFPGKLAKGIMFL